MMDERSPVDEEKRKFIID